MSNKSLIVNSWDSKSFNESHKLSVLKAVACIGRSEDVQNKLNLSIKTDTCGYCDGYFREVVKAFNGIHGHISFIVCIVGVLANTMNMYVLMRRDMAGVSINRLLKCVGVADIFVMLEITIYTIAKYLILPEKWDCSYLAMFLLMHLHLEQISHTVSICLTLSLSIWRFITIKYSDRSHILCTQTRCSIAILISLILPTILHIPTFMLFGILPNETYLHGDPDIVYYVDYENNEKLYEVNFWIQAVIIKLLPCLILTINTWWLVKALYRANEHQKNLRNYSNCPVTEKMIKRQHMADKRTNKTTKILIAVLLLFLVTELPQGILALMSGLLGSCFYRRCYYLFEDLMDFLVLLNGGVNLTLYSSMSGQFRQTYRELILRKYFERFLPPTATHTESINLNTAKSSIVGGRIQKPPTVCEQYI